MIFGGFFIVLIGSKLIMEGIFVIDIVFFDFLNFGIKLSKKIFGLLDLFFLAFPELLFLFFAQMDILDDLWLLLRWIFFSVFGFRIKIIDPSFLIDDMTDFDKLFNKEVDLFLLGVNIVSGFSLGLIKLTDRIIIVRVSTLIWFGSVVP
jgi:hypothetical protein